jgi:lactate racemase
MKSAVVPILAWYGDETLELDFPESWEVTVCNMKGINAPVLSDKEIRAAFSRHIGSKTIKELVKGKKEVAILFDDLTRPTPSILLVPYIIEQLSEAGIQDKNIRFISALGAHGSMDNIAFRKKLGDEVTGRFLVYNHNPYENCTPLGKSSRGTPIAANSEMMNRCKSWQVEKF